MPFDFVGNCDIIEKSLVTNQLSDLQEMKPGADVTCHQPVHADGMGAKRPGLGVNHADMFRPILHTDTDARNAPAYVEYITEAEGKHFQRKNKNQGRVLAHCTLTYMEGGGKWKPRHVVMTKFKNLDKAIACANEHALWGAVFTYPKNI